MCAGQQRHELIAASTDRSNMVWLAAGGRGHVNSLQIRMASPDIKGYELLDEIAGWVS